MLRKNPELRPSVCIPHFLKVHYLLSMCIFELHEEPRMFTVWHRLFFTLILFQLLFQAADLLRHPHLQPYVLKILLNSDCPRQLKFPVQSSNSTYVKKKRLSEPRNAPVFNEREQRRLSSDRALNPSISGMDSPCLSRRAKDLMSSVKKNSSELSVESSPYDLGVKSSVISKLSAAVKTVRFNSNRNSTPHRRQSTPLKMSNAGSTRELVSFWSNSIIKNFNLKSK